MHIGIHAATLPPRLTGRENYVRSLLEALSEIDGDNEYSIFVSPANRHLFERREKNFRSVVLRLPRLPSRRLWETAYLRSSVQVRRLDLIHLMEAPIPFYQPAKAVATVHDVLPAVCPQFFPWKARFYYGAAYRWGTRGLSGITVDSEQTKRDLVDRFGVVGERVRVIYHAVNRRFKPSDEAATEAVRKKYELPSRFALYVGTIEPRKNLAGLVRAFRLARERGLPHSLVLAGGKGWLADEIMREANDKATKRYVRFTGFVDDDDLPALYGAAEFFIYPSLYEGFGVPPLEAMASAVPVICSNRSSLPEVTGDAALLVDPEDEREMAEAIWEMANDEVLRARLKSRGLERASLFSWEKTARETLDFYDQVHRGLCPASQGEQQDAA